MPTLFKVNDPDGTAVACDSRWWGDHIVRRHPELSGHEKVVAQAIERPFGIYRSATHANRRVFYAPSAALPPPFNRGLLRVVVEYRTRRFAGSRRGQVITAMHAIKPARGEILTWPEA